MNFQSLLAQNVADRPQRIAFYDESRAWSYLELSGEVDRIARVLHEQGATDGDRLALWMPNCIQWLVVFLACARLGVTVVSVNTRFREHEVGQLLERGNCRWLAVWPDFKGLPFAQILAAIDPDVLAKLKGILGVGNLESLRSSTTCLPLVPYDSQPTLKSLDNVAPVADNAGALVYTTSGTTSAPKLVLHRQAGLIAHGTSAAVAYEIHRDSVVLLAAPLCGAFGFSTALSGLAVGAQLVSSPVFNAVETVRQIQEHKVTHTYANNELIDLLLKQVKGQTLPFPSLKYVGFASFATSLEDLPERARDAGLPIAGLYGSSELQALVTGHRLDTPWEHRRIAGGTLASPDGRVRAISVENEEVLPHGDVGLIEIKTPSLMSEYLDNPEATAKVISSDGYFRTGDLGWTLNEREFVFQGRNGDYLRLGGFLVNPIEIESFIEQFDGVKACQVVGAEYIGRLVPVAFVILDAEFDVSEATMIEKCIASMARFKVPQRIATVAAFPVVESANSNKIQRSRLQQMAKELLTNQPQA
jgi:fatty-acyl-CoA synthase